eukprot:2552173-Rhodomonas_salina.3
MLRIDLSDYMGLLNAFSDEIVMAPLHGVNKIALISVNSGICVLVDHVNSTVHVCHSPELQKGGGGSEIAPWKRLFGGRGRARGEYRTCSTKKMCFSTGERIGSTGLCVGSTGHCVGSTGHRTGSTGYCFKPTRSVPDSA